MTTPVVLKIKVLFTAGAGVALYALARYPELAKELLTFAVLFVVVGFVFYLEDILKSVVQLIKAIRRARIPQATKIRSTQSEAYVEPCKNIDYENYLIPTYLRQQGGMN